jgi:YebC/PmpR family DNA-binding regulatory protein
MAGHSKWAQIKHKKAAADAKKGQLFSKLIKEIMVSVKTGGDSPATNVRLRSAIERARSAGLPKDNIERAIKRASGGEDGRELQEFIYEATAPGGAAIIIEGITDNKNRTLAELKHILNEQGGKLAEQGSLMWNFKKIGLIELTVEDNPEKTPEEIELAIIESGADDFKKLDGEWIVETKFEQMEKVRQEIESRGIKIKEISHDYRAQTTTALPEQTAAETEKLLDIISEHDDVQGVYTNIVKENRI